MRDMQVIQMSLLGSTKHHLHSSKENVCACVLGGGGGGD